MLSLLIFDERDKSIIFDPTLTINPPIIFLSTKKFKDNLSPRIDFNFSAICFCWISVNSSAEVMSAKMSPLFWELISIKWIIIE